jgi:hypothetical protein
MTYNPSATTDAALARAIAAANPNRPPAPPANPFATHPNDDPDHGAARAARDWYRGRVAEIRNDPMTSDLAKTRALAEAHRQHVQDMTDAHSRLTARRQARLDYLTGLVPDGPGIPEGTSPADKAALMTAWRAAIDAVRNAPNRNARAALLAEAQRYGDDIMTRAALTLARETGDLGVVDGWVQQTHDVKGWQAETGQLRGALAGERQHAPWDYLDFHAEQAPKEIAQLPAMEARAGQGEAA